jgi:hypothetical protein
MSGQTPSLLGPVTEQDMTRWQLKGVKALTELLTQAFRQQLPALDWQLGTGSSLYGTVQQPTFDAAQKRAAFDQWARHLGADVWPETTDPAGGTRLRAKVEDHLGVHVTIAADLYGDE